jgi:hypothetical protein
VLAPEVGVMWTVMRFLGLARPSTVALVGISACHSSGEKQGPDAGVRPQTAQGAPRCERASFGHGPVQLADFSLEYLGATDQPPLSNGLHLGPVQRFRVVSAAGESKEVSWSSGTGEIAPTFFNLGRKQYSLEMMESDHVHGRLASDEVVVCPNDTPYTGPQIQ